MASTTLMTFLLSTHPHVQSVKLLGSWDNFSQPYIMERDKRVGAGQWRGCHTFSNIVCDGSPTHMTPARSGGLKMGGTYWYYYLLDNDVEYYNEAEPVTTHCPLLPGQPVNVLNVPVILPDTFPTHTHARSPSSQKADHRTMNPEDKYMNPRQPPKPKLPRLRTSPPLLQQPAPAWSFSTSPLGIITHRGASQPSSATPKAKGLDAPRAAGCKAARSVSPPRSRGLRAAFRHWNTSSPDLGSTEDDCRANKPAANHGLKGLFGRQEEHSYLAVQPPATFESSPLAAPSNVYQHSTDSLLRTPGNSGERRSVPLTIQDRRALNSKITENGSHRTPLTVQTKPGSESSDKLPTREGQRHIVRRSLPMESPAMLSTAIGPSTFDLTTTPTGFTIDEKRLPTLPNTPSSVMDQALRDIDEQEKALDPEALGSHFSDFTDTESVAGSSVCERSHFSEWTVDTDVLSPKSMACSITVTQDAQVPPTNDFAGTMDFLKTSIPADLSDPDTPHLTVNSQSAATSIAGDSPRLDLPLPRLSISLSPSDLDIPGLYIDDEDRVESNPKRHAAFFGADESIKGLGLLQSPDPSTLQFPEDVTSDKTPRNSQSLAAPCKDSERFSRVSLLGQSAAMREMMDELSYLKHMIDSGSGAEF
ncbi:hypothetical protein AtubIFM55763_003128 [Aspergillus tubingensis]|uniref:Uncharacterized protein n=1 Tax=Aspergillus tubingensis TaxID=5068 RepID=A0A8H3SSL0_ASPTU|nr:anaphase-promoting complex subunit 4 [Aspergillus tubingensis]GFN14185.1 anaphase-promoting complex subunit 4 [Aspergillus tubingensis]GLA72585.1 hypothetical protein AtubIFM55763_003128 [Aspergillus tubingensis]GLA88546.1 hypothetical protein AtubIFM56815_003002 [Aspergillus tubingensis]GLB12850.1 hypothetical protein AtubIFM61612_000237 [Aspergillus tubingensis]